ncbi:MAG: hypothetical protein HN353_10485 [Bdellovibrionales bacterium]|jgi:cell division protein FtsN|nr:hypothetical protein [Bdellovibrionales bacterium]MBT3524720.1 hypothetical protein [Bdellovibrionales bacterium]MBT7668762.1 hypothetical protein [Bdellovibrionales bacterium]MBT7766941.1 hypothetical protein [Bdellovibrionales bacterium]
MDDNSKLYVFARKEIALIFLFMILIAAASFVLGVKLGKSHSYQAAGVSIEDRQQVELLSGEEEQVEQAVQLQEKQQQPAEEIQQELAVDTYSQLEREFEQLDQEKEQVNSNQQETLAEDKSSEVSETAVEQGSAASSSDDKGNDILSVAEKKAQIEAAKESKTTATNKEKALNLNGKYTIQLGSYQSLKDAEQFADGFKVKGYNPIINEVDIKGRGRWFRVSLGAFDTGREAREYIKKEKSLFRRKEAIISRF